MVIERNTVHFDEDEGHLRLDCDDERFIQIRDFVLAEVPPADGLDLYADGIRSIAIRREAAPSAPAPARVRRTLAYVFISMALTAVLVIQIAGMIAIARWFLGRAA